MSVVPPVAVVAPGLRALLHAAFRPPRVTVSRPTLVAPEAQVLRRSGIHFGRRGEKGRVEEEGPPSPLGTRPGTVTSLVSKNRKSRETRTSGVEDQETKSHCRLCVREVREKEVPQPL